MFSKASSLIDAGARDKAVAASRQPKAGEPTDAELIDRDMPISHTSDKVVCVFCYLGHMEFRSDIEVGKVLQELRNQADLRQTDLAASIGVDQPTFSRIEKGERAITAREVLLLADFLDVDSDQILRKTPPASEMLLRASEDSDEATRRCAAIFNECIEDYFGLEAMAS